jgi:hypothetical protein
MKKTIVTFLLVFSCVSMLGAQPPGPSPWLGDADANEIIDIVDALLTAQYYVGLFVDRVIEQNGDVNQDGHIDIVDALIIAEYYAGIIEYLPGDSIYGRTQKDLAKKKENGKTFSCISTRWKCRSRRLPFHIPMIYLL